MTKKICDYFDIDYLRLISSGCMIIMTPPDKKEEMEAAMEKAGVKLSCIGVIKEASEGIRMEIDGESMEIAPPASDELYKVVGH